MLKNAFVKLLLPILLLGSAAAPVLAADSDCVPIGGVAIADFFSEGEGKPITISATLTGAVKSTAGKILVQRETSTGLEMEMEHYFGTDDGGAFKTRDLAILTAVPGKAGRYMIEVTYHIQEDVTRGTLKGIKGTIRSYGLPRRFETYRFNWKAPKTASMWRGFGSMNP